LSKFLEYKILFILKKRAPCKGSCKIEAGQTCKNSFGRGYMGTYCAPNYTCEEFGPTTEDNYY
jgi:hypothetical protein